LRRALRTLTTTFYDGSGSTAISGIAMVKLYIRNYISFRTFKTRESHLGERLQLALPYRLSEFWKN
jgi:hypothetical protein